MTKKILEYNLDGIKLELEEVEKSTCHEIYNILLDEKKDGELKYVVGGGWTFYSDRFFLDQNWRGYELDDMKSIIIREYNYAKTIDDLRKDFGDDFLEG